MPRRAWVLVSTGTAFGLWDGDGQAVASLPGAFVTALAGVCSACGRGMPDAHTMIVAVGSEARLCDACTARGVEALARQGVEVEGALDPPSSRERHDLEAVLADLDQVATEAGRGYGATVQAMVDKTRARLEGRPSVTPRPAPVSTGLRCSVCDEAPGDAHIHTSSATTKVCDACLAEALRAGRAIARDA